MKKVLTRIYKNAMLIHTYIHAIIQEGGLCSHLPNKEKRWNSYLTISPLSGGCDGN